ncbi:unnamed protein product [Staurois parvus]|uniref:Uncharacterized protein n=1 Tax=Staurois parvus TaxID=386267 RepID=A0ABN9H4F4_9NEOB|nr:unnamed protein product [Staurois parvus]
MTKKIQLQKTRHASYEVRQTVYFAKKGSVLTFGGYLSCSDIWGISVLF